MSKAREGELVSVSFFLDSLELSKDVVIKKPVSFPLVRRGSDVDIYSLRPDMLIEKIVEATLDRTDESLTVYSVEEGHFQIDLRDESGLVVKFDIYGSFPKYGRFSIRENLFVEIVAGGVLEKKGKEIQYPVPQKRHDAFIRYIEYCEFFWIGPDKIHHLDWILAKLSATERHDLFEHLHQNILPPPHEEISAESKKLLLLAGWNRVRVKGSINPKKWRDNLYRVLVRPLIR